jgi:hypothetical protein
MRRALKSAVVSALVACVLLTVSESAFAQMDIVGEWAPLFHEDTPDRLPGPGPVDFTGLPLTDGARQWALSGTPRVFPHSSINVRFTSCPTS